LIQLIILENIKNRKEYIVGIFKLYKINITVTSIRC